MKSVKRLALVIASLVAVYALLYAVGLQVESRRLNAERAAANAVSLPTTWEQLLGKPVPESENAAPIYARIFTEMKTSGSEQAIGIIEGSRVKVEAMNPTEFAQYRQALSKLSPMFSLLSEAVSRPHYQLSVTRYQKPGSAFADYAKMRSIARLTAASARVHARLGETEGAIEALRLGFRSSAQIQEQSTLISHLVGVATTAIQCSVLRNVEQSCSLNYDQEKRLFDLLGETDLNKGYACGLQGEAVLVSTSKNREVTDGRHVIYRITDGVKAQRLHDLRQVLKTSNMTYRTARLTGLVPDLLGSSSAGSPPLSPLTALRSRFLPGFTPVKLYSQDNSSLYYKAMLKRDQGIATLGGERIVLALIAYKDRFGSYPQTLAQLCAKLGWDLPKDVFSGKDYAYSPKNSGFLLYSIGPDLTDNGGKIDWRKHGYKEGDMIWERK